MDNFFKMVNTQSILFLYMLVGCYCRKKNIFTDAVRGKLTDFVVGITLPCMVFESFKMPFSIEILKRGATSLVIATVMAVIAFGLGKILYNAFNAREKCIMQYGTLVANSAFAGLPVVSGAYGAEGMFLGSFFVIPTRILMWSAGISLFSCEGTKRERIKKVLLNPSIIAVIIGLIRMVFQIPLPDFFDVAIDEIGACTSPMAMAIVGAILADVKFKSVFESKSLYLVLIRQVVLPVICLVGLKTLKIDSIMTGISVTMTGMPIGSTTAILAQKYGADAKFASKCVFISTLTSLITVPILTLFI